MSDGVIWYGWDDPSFRELTDPEAILRQDVSAALDEPEGAFPWAPLASMEWRRYRNAGMDSVRIADLESRVAGVLADGELIASASAVGQFSVTKNLLTVDVGVEPVDFAPLSMRLTDADPGFEVVSE